MLPSEIDIIYSLQKYHYILVLQLKFSRHMQCIKLTKPYAA